MKRTWQPKKRKRARTHGFRARMRTRHGRAIIAPSSAQGPQAPHGLDGRAASPGARVASGSGRLSRSGDFDRAYRDGRSQANRHLVLYAFPRGEDDDDDEVRLGVSVGRKVGGAVERNKVKRAMREAFWSLSDRACPPVTTSSSSAAPAWPIWSTARAPKGSANRSRRLLDEAESESK